MLYAELFIRIYDLYGLHKNIKTYRTFSFTSGANKNMKS